LKKFNLDHNFEIFFETPDDNHSYFFGYYDKSPLDINNSKLLVHRASFDGRKVADGDLVQVGYFDLKINKYIKIDETLAWNWQQGSNLQWLPPDYSNKVIYNNIHKDKFISIIYDINSKKKKIIPFPIYSVHPNGKEALGINYERLYWCREGYNYQNIKANKWNVPYHKEDGISKIDLITGKTNLIISTNLICKIKKFDDIENKNNWLEHIMYNPSGNRFIFFHRWGNEDKVKSRVFSANKNGKDLYLYPDVFFYSHYSWISDNLLSIWTLLKNETNSLSKKTFKIVYKNKILKNILKFVYNKISNLLSLNLKLKLHPQAKLHIFKDKSNKPIIIDNEILFTNGHQTWFNDKKRVLIDSYEDKHSYRHLIIYDSGNNNYQKIGTFYSMYNESEFRCDLHPRLSKDNKFIVIDSAHRKKRKILVIKIK